MPCEVWNTPQTYSHWLFILVSNFVTDSPLLVMDGCLKSWVPSVRTPKYCLTLVLLSLYFTVFGVYPFFFPFLILFIHIVFDINWILERPHNFLSFPTKVFITTPFLSQLKMMVSCTKASHLGRFSFLSLTSASETVCRIEPPNQRWHATDPSATLVTAAEKSHGKAWEGISWLTELKLHKGNSSEQATGICLLTKFMNFTPSKLIGDIAYTGLANVN